MLLTKKEIVLDNNSKQDHILFVTFKRTFRPFYNVPFIPRISKEFLSF